METCMLCGILYDVYNINSCMDHPNTCHACTKTCSCGTNYFSKFCSPDKCYKSECFICKIPIIQEQYEQCSRNIQGGCCRFNSKFTQCYALCYNKDDQESYGCSECLKKYAHYSHLDGYRIKNEINYK